jgi:hypothetical protein
MNPEISMSVVSGIIGTPKVSSKSSQKEIEGLWFIIGVLLVLIGVFGKGISSGRVSLVGENCQPCPGGIFTGKVGAEVLLAALRGGGEALSCSVESGGGYANIFVSSKLLFPREMASWYLSFWEQLWQEPWSPRTGAI